MEYKILDSRWLSGKNTIGVIAYETDQHLSQEERTWCAAIGLATGINEHDDEQEIAGWGTKLSEQEGKAFFPYIVSRKYKKD